jgi:hypothetical protein
VVVPPFLYCLRQVDTKIDRLNPHHELETMPIDLPYAADAEISLSYDELIVRTNLSRLSGTRWA